MKNGLRIPLPDGQATHQVASLPAGGLDYRAMRRTALKHGFDGPLVIERCGGDAIAQARIGRQDLEQLIADLT